MEEMNEHAKRNGLGHWRCISNKSNEWWRRFDGVEATYDGFGTYIELLQQIDRTCPMKQITTSNENK